MTGLTELVAISTNPPAAAGSSASPEAYISFHDIHTYTPQTILKKSSSPRNCLAISPTHVFAAQSDKQVLNVYSRAKNNLETTIPLPEPISAVTCSRNGGIVALGTSTGRVNVWETSSGRYTSTPLSHLQKITTITLDPTATFLLTGSEDTTIHVWSLPHLTTPQSANSKPKQPLKTLEYHQQAIISVVCGRGSGPSAIAVSLSKDCSCIVWNYLEGVLLRTFSLGSGVPTSLAIDTADRGFYVGFEDGTIQQVEFARLGGNRAVDLTNGNGATTVEAGLGERGFDSLLYRGEDKHVPVSVAGSGARWNAEGQASPVTAIDVMFEGNYLVAGTEAGVVNVWDVATGHLFRTLMSYKAPISSILLLPPTGFTPSSSSTPLVTQQTVIPPRYHDAVKATSLSTTDTDPSLPPLTLQFNGILPSATNQPSLIDPFSPASDLAAADRGVAYFSSPAFTADGSSKSSIQYVETAVSSTEDAEKIDALQKELEVMKERYKRLNEVHKQTWEEHTKWVMEVDKEKAEKMEREREKGGDEMQIGE